MDAIDKLRNIARYSNDSKINFEIEAWINRYTIEIGNSFVISKLNEDTAKHIEHYNKSALMDIASAIIERYSELNELPLRSSLKPTEMKSNDLDYARKFERRITIVLDKAR